MKKYDIIGYKPNLCLIICEKCLTIYNYKDIDLRITDNTKKCSYCKQ